MYSKLSIKKNAKIFNTQEQKFTTNDRLLSLTRIIEKMKVGRRVAKKKIHMRNRQSIVALFPPTEMQHKLQQTKAKDGAKQKKNAKKTGHCRVAFECIFVSLFSTQHRMETYFTHIGN